MSVFEHEFKERFLKCSLEELIPYAQWRRGQREVLEYVQSSLKENSIIVLEAPTGFGKTLPVILATLKRALEEGKKVLYLVRTKNEALAPFRELRRISRHTGLNIPFAIFRNKKEMCAVKEFHELEYEDFLQRCRILREKGYCRYFKSVEDVEPEKLSKIVQNTRDMQKLADALILRGLCPYESMRKVGERSWLIIGAYPYLFHEQTRESFMRSLNLKLDELIVVVDEAHGLPDYLSSLYSHSFTLSDLRKARKEARTYLGLEETREVLEVLRRLEAWMKSVVQSTAQDIVIRRESEIVSLLGSIEKFSDLVRKAYLRFIAENRPQTFHLMKILKGIEAVSSMYEGYVLCVFRDPLPTFCYRCTLPSVKVERIFSNVWATVLMSGTMPLREYLQATLGLKEKNMLEFRVRGTVGRLRAIVARDVTTRYEERSPSMLEKYAKYVCQAFNVARRVVMVVAPSYDVARQLFANLVGLGVRSIILEREDTRIESVTRKVYTHIERRGKGPVILLAVAGGKLAEGIELRFDGRSFIDIVIIAGIPYPEPSAYTEALLREIMKALKDPGKAWRQVFETPALVKILQAVGRALRSEEDKALVILLDRRVLERETFREVATDLDPNFVECTLADFMEKASKLYSELGLS